MKKRHALFCLLGGWVLAHAQPAAAQDLAITNARILDGNGGVIEQGTVVVRDGRIESVSAASTPAEGTRIIDVGGMTVMPAFIDGHRHVIDGDPDRWLEEQVAPRMRQFLEAGFTTILSAGDPLDQILELRRRLEDGELEGPRLIAAGRAPLAAGGSGFDPGVDPARSDRSRAPRTEAAPAIPENQTRATVRELAEAGVDAIKTVITVTPGGPEQRTLSLIVEEAGQHGIPVITHAVTVEDTVAAVEAGVTTLVHTPHIGLLDEQTARMIADAGIPMMSTLGVFVPAFAADNALIREQHGADDDVARFRDLEPYPPVALSSAGLGPVNARFLWDAGITYGFGTDTRFLPSDALAHELRPLRLVFSAREIVEIMTRNAAAAVGLEDELGTLEPGKLADIVVIDGDPLADIHDVLNVEMVIKDGDVVVDSRDMSEIRSELDRARRELMDARRNLEDTARDLARLSAEAVGPIVDDVRRRFQAGQRAVLGGGVDRWQDLELATLTPELGDYFGASEGFLVLRAPEDGALPLRDGDVILDINGRMPTSPEHAMRILASFEPGETLRLTVIRRQQRETLEARLAPNPPSSDARAD